MVVVGVLVADTDDAELLGVCRPLVVAFAALEADDHSDIDVLATQVSDDVEDLRAFDLDKIAPNRPWTGSNERIRALLQPTHEEAVVLVDQRKTGVLEEGQIK